MCEFCIWKYYKGGMVDDIWVYNLGNKIVENVINNVVQDIFLMWIGDEIFFFFDCDCIMNIFVYNMKIKQIVKVMNFIEYDVKFLSVYGNIIVFENGGYIYKMDVVVWKVEKVNIILVFDNIYVCIDLKEGVNYVIVVSFLLDGVWMVVISWGEVFNLLVEKGVIKNIICLLGVYDCDVQWLLDGIQIVYIFDVIGEIEFYLQNVVGGELMQLIYKNDIYICDFKWSLDFKKIVYMDCKN